MVKVKIDGQEFYIDKKLSERLDKVRKRVKTKDEDYFFAVDGEEGSGKSVLAMQLAKYLDHDFSLKQVCFSGDEFRDAILKSKKGQCIVYDEAFRGLSSRSALSEVNKLLVSLMMECRQKNLFVIVVMPTFFLLEKYVALWRAKGLFHVYKSDGKRGFWVYFNKRKKKILYLTGKQTYTYTGHVKSSFKGRFTDHYTIDEANYREKKASAFQMTNRETKDEKHLHQRNALLWFLNKERDMSTTEISTLLKRLKIGLDQRSVSSQIKKIEKEFKKWGVLQS